MDAPEQYERFEFLITQPYIIDTENINFSDLSLNAIENQDGDFEIEITNNSVKKIDSLDIVVIYYKDGKIVDINQNSVFDISSGEVENDSIYNFQDMNTYDDVKFIINDVYIYE